MTALIWMLTWLPQVLPAMSELLPPVNVILTSNHFSHMLKWAPAPGTPTGVYYNVLFGTESETSLVPVAGCERVQHPLVCNLTKAFSEPAQVYLTQVTAHLKAQASQPFTNRAFQPIKDTHLDLPLLTVTPCGRDLCVDLQPHMEHLRKFYDLLQYELRIKSSDSDRALLKKIKSLSRETLEDLAPGRQYCVSVRILDDMVPRKSNFSQPQCAFTPGVYTADAWISGVLCFVVMSVVVVLGLLVHTGSICLKQRPLPSVLTSIHHIEEVLVVVPCGTALSSLLNLKAALPSSGGKRSSQTLSDESDGESETETTAGSTGGGYKLRMGTDLLSASSLSSSSLSAPLSLEPVVPPISPSNPNAMFLPSDFFSPQPEAPISAAGLNHTRTTHTASLSDSLPEPQQRPPADTDSLTVETLELKKEEAGDVGSQDVNLLTLTFGRREEKGEEEEEGEKSHVDISEVEPESTSATLLLPSQTVDTEEVAIETISCSVVEEEEEAELSAYMRRPVSDVLQNLL